VHADTGSLLWTSPIALHTRSSPAISQGRVYLGDEAGRVTCLDVATGTLRWEGQLGGRMSGCPVVTPTGVLFAGDEGELAWYGLDGKRQWQLTLPSRLAGQPVATQSQLLIPHETGLAVLRQTDGKPDPRLTLPTYANPIISVIPYDDQLFILGGNVRIEKSNGQSFTFQDTKSILWKPKAVAAP
jgi:outer membrane protein assembly factor BamB